MEKVQIKFALILIGGKDYGDQTHTTTIVPWLYNSEDKARAAGELWTLDSKVLRNKGYTVIPVES